MSKNSALFLIIMSIFCSHVLKAQTVMLDNSFGTNGINTSLFTNGSLAKCLKIQPDGKILLAGTANNDFAILRYNANGTPDNDFGKGGIVTTDFNNGANDFANSILLLNNGKILVAGYTNIHLNTDFALAQYNQDGSIDLSFGKNGSVVTSFSEWTDQATCMALQPDGKIVVAGFSWNGSNNDFAITRYNADGSMDSKFGDNGLALTDFGGSNEFIYSLAVKPNGKILVSGFSNIAGINDLGNTSESNNFALVQYNENGNLDQSFGTNGKSVIDFNNSYDCAYSMIVQPDGKIVVAGSAGIKGISEFALARFNASGSLDFEFGIEGKTTADIGQGSDFAYSASLQTDEKIVLAGFSFNGKNNDFSMARFNTNGTLDFTFNKSGKLLSPIGKSDDIAYCLGVQTDGKIILAGFSNINNTNAFAIARFNALDLILNGVENTIPKTVEKNEVDETNKIFIEQFIDISISLIQPDLVYTPVVNNEKIETTISETKSNNFKNIGFSVSQGSVVLYPNPVVQNATLEYTLITNTSVTIYIRDFNGRLIQTILNGQEQSAGIYFQPIVLPTDLAVGNYFISLSSPGGQVNIKIIKIRN